MYESNKMILARYKRYEKYGFKKLTEHESKENTLKRMEAVRKNAIESLLQKDRERSMDALDDILPYFCSFIGDLRKGL